MRNLVVLLMLGLTFAGCLSDDGSGSGTGTGPDTPAVPDLGPVVNATLAATMTFAESVVTAGIHYTNDLYEPTLEVSDTGVIYITGHTMVVDTTGAPVYFSKDDGATWKQLPWTQTVAFPNQIHGATPPPSDEIFLMAGDDGWLYGVDITLATYPVNAWSGDGAMHAYHNPNAYDESQVAIQAREGCTPVPAKDRPWGAYSNGTLLLVSNPAGGPAQVGVMQVPPAIPIGVGTAPDGIEWNLCAGPGGSIPGIPDIRGDGLFAVPQRSQGALYLVLGNKDDILATEIVPVFKHTSGSEITSVYGIAAFDGDGTLFVGISNNTAPDDQGRRQGQLLFAASEDGGQTFLNRTFALDGMGPVRHFYLDANDGGPGALAVWAVNGSAQGLYDYYVGHVQLGSDGGPVLENVALAVDDGPQPSAHVTGAGVGPDGRAYLAMFRTVPTGGTPLSVYIQKDGPTLPVA